MTPSLPIIVSFIIKALTLLGLGLYGIFAVVMVRQEQLMAGVLEEGFEPILRLLTILHFAGAVGIFILALILL
ncbi:MAG: hypothetical protein UY10_C0004G0006 [Microgenomates group bacterium GW2011_GWA2_47_8]|nr:MAG: hypothetical protein UY10_C0004G0006 [Microgenomates group bacterium GW2011_GWA2_47_8]